MSGYVFAMGLCASCGEVISFHHHKVLSRSVNGIRQPVCAACREAIISEIRLQLTADTVNLVRAALCLPLLPAPLPDAYEPCPKEELERPLPAKLAALVADPCQVKNQRWFSGFPRMGGDQEAAKPGDGSFRDMGEKP